LTLGSISDALECRLASRPAVSLYAAMHVVALQV